VGIAVVRASVFDSLNPSSGLWSTPIRYVELVPSAVLLLISLLAILLFAPSMTAGCSSY